MLLTGIKNVLLTEINKILLTGISNVLVTGINNVWLTVINNMLGTGINNIYIYIGYWDVTPGVQGAVKEETSEPPKAASESPTEPQQHPELTGTFTAPTGTSSSRQQQLHPPPNYAHCHSPRAQTGFSPFLDHQ